jgi:multiple sugar transport system substrate-binding protein
VGYLQPPVGTWDGKTYRITIDGDCHTFSLPQGLFRRGRHRRGRSAEDLAAGQRLSKALVGQTDPLTGLPAYGYLDPLKGWGGFGFYFLGNRATAYVKHPDDRPGCSIPTR